MNIAVIAPIEETVPPSMYGGTEWIVYHVAHGMGARGHKVDLYAAGNSRKESNYTLVPTATKSVRAIPEIVNSPKIRDMTKFISCAETIEKLSTKKYDIIHNHDGWRYILFSSFLNGNIVTTHHGPLSIPHHNLVYKKFKDLPYVSISNNQRKDLPELNFIDTVYNGIDVDLFPYSEESMGSDAPMVFLARLSPEKGPTDAAKVARMTKRKIIVAAKVDAVDQKYFEEFKPLIDNNIVTFRGELLPEARYELLKSARCLLVPIKWEEPFGLMFIEAMACGMPVVTYARGAAPEIVVDGVTGFLVNQSEEFKRGEWTVKKMGLDGLAEAVERIYSMSDLEYRKMRQASRAHVEKNFTVEAMVEGYEAVYKKVLNEGGVKTG